MVRRLDVEQLRRSIAKFAPGARDAVGREDALRLHTELHHVQGRLDALGRRLRELAEEVRGPASAPPGVPRRLAGSSQLAPCWFSPSGASNAPRRRRRHRRSAFTPTKVQTVGVAERSRGAAELVPPGTPAADGKRPRSRPG
jgi:hypothetical protein